MKTKNFLNLTNGLEFEVKNPNFIRIQSTTLERKDYLKLLLDLDHNFLMWLALGYKCNVYDCGTNKPFSKTIYSGIEIIRYCLNREWYGIIPKDVKRIKRNGEQTTEDISGYYNSIYENLFVYDNNKSKEKLKRKLRYYKRYLNSDQVHLFGISKSTYNDGKIDYYSLLAKRLYDSRKGGE